MNKKEFVEAVLREARCTHDRSLNKADREAVLKSCGNVMAAELLGGGHVPLPGIGRLITKQRAARQGRNPRTGAAVTIPASRVVLLRVGKDLKAALK